MTQAGVESFGFRHVRPAYRMRGGHYAASVKRLAVSQAPYGIADRSTVQLLGAGQETLALVVQGEPPRLGRTAKGRNSKAAVTLGAASASVERSARNDIASGRFKPLSDTAPVFAGADLMPIRYATASLRLLPGLKPGTVLALIAMGSPVCGLRPVRASRNFT